MSTYSATVQLNNGTLTVTRPHPSTDDVDGVIDGLLFSVRDDDSTVTSIGVTIVTSDGTGTPAAADAPDPSQLTTDSLGAHSTSDAAASA